MPWGFYGRTDELRMTAEIIGRNRWFFAKMTGRRRIGKTTLIQHAIQTRGREADSLRPDSGLRAGRRPLSGGRRSRKFQRF